MKYFLLGLMIINTFWAIAQDANNSARHEGNAKLDDKKKYFSVGLELSGAHYFGDLHEFNFGNLIKTSRLRPGISLHGMYTLNSNYEVVAALSWQRIFADDFQYADPNASNEIYAYTRNLHFRNDLLGFQAFLKYKLFKNTYTYLERPFVNPFFRVGFSINYSNPKARLSEFAPNNERFRDGGKWTALRPLGTEGQFNNEVGVSPYGPLQLSIPMGIGSNIRVHDKMDISVALSYSFFFTDYLDDVSGDYVDLGALEGEKAKVLSDRSLEVNASIVNQPRNMEKILEFTEYETYVSEFDGQSYTVLQGFGSSNERRGDDTNFDFIIYGSIKLTYILAPSKQKNIF